MEKETSSEELCAGFPIEFYKYVEYTKNLEYEENPDYDMLKQLFLDVINKRKEKLDYIYDWTTNSDLQRRKENTKKDSTDNESYNEKSNKKEKDIESNNNDQIDKINEQKLKREITQDKYDKVESVCCIMYVYNLYNF